MDRSDDLITDGTVCDTENLYKMTAETGHEENSDDGLGQNTDEDNASETSSDSEGEEAAKEREAAALEEKIVANPYDYNSHVTLISCLEKLGDFDKLRVARKRMHTYFPLTPELWLSWLRNEITIATSEEEKKAILDLFEKAVQDYLSIDIWLTYIQFCISCLGAEIDKSGIRDICEKAVTVAGHHFPRGIELWDAYREFESSLIPGLKDNERVSQVQRVASVWSRQLSLPLRGTDTRYQQFATWADHEGIPITVDLAKVGADIRRLEKFEQQLASCDSGRRIQLLRDYCRREADDSRMRATCMWERTLAETEGCLDPSLWHDYLEFVYQHGAGTAGDVLPLCERSVRNCPWSVMLWQFYLRILERFGKPHADVTDVMERALAACADSAESLRAVWLTFSSYMCRRVKWAEESTPGIEELRSTFNKACEHLAQCFGLQGDPNCEILQYWSRIEGGRVGDMSRARQLWNDILSQGHNSSAAMWLEYINLERLHGEHKRLRSMFARALSSVQDWPESIYNAWINYERDEGTLDTLEECEMKYKRRMEDIQRQREKEQARQEKEQARHDKKRNMDTKAHDQRKQGKRKAEEMESEGKWAKVPAAGSVLTDKELESLKTAEEPKSPAKKSKKDDELTSRAHGTTVTHDPSKDDRTVFVSNLAFTETEEAVRQFFEGIGTITDLRLVRDFKGRFKGYCYVEFSTSVEAAEALKKDREPMNNRPVFVSKCDPDRQTRQPVFKYSTALEKNKLFVKGLAFTTTNKDLEELFKIYGPLKEVRVVTYRNGHSKGIAYVEFEDEVCASRALQATDGMTLAGHVISVALSRPPEKKDKASAAGVAPTISELVGPKGIGMRKMAMFPRSVQLASRTSSTGSASTSSSSSTTVSNGETRKPLSNADFRKFLMSGKET